MRYTVSRNRILGAVLAVTLGLGVVLMPSAAPSASAHSSLERSVLAKINSDRRAKHAPTLKSNYYLQKFAEAGARHLASHPNDEDYLADVQLAPDATSGDTPSLVTFTCSMPATGRFASSFANLVGVGAHCGENVQTAWKDPEYNYGDVEIVKTSKNYYLYYVYASYETQPLSTLYSATPTISGSVRVGATLTGHRHTWTPATGATFEYRWFVDGVQVSEGQTFAPSVDQLGKRIYLSVVGTKAGYFAPERTSKSYTIASGYLKKGKTSISGSRNVGETLTADPGAWAPANTVFTYQWLRSGHPITDATSASYQLVAADYGKKIDVKVTGSATGYVTSSTTTKTSHRTARPLLEAAPTPSILGDIAVGSVLSVDTGTWQPDGVSLKYQWRLNGHAIYHATHSTYTVPLSAVGKKITVSVTGSLPGYATAVRTSEPSVAVPSLPFTTEGVATITGTAAVGKTLTAHAGTWSPKASFTYRWYRDGVAISRATKSTYKVTSSSAGHTLSVHVAASRTGYTKTIVVSSGVDIP
jgi:hypothetical protein